MPTETLIAAVGPGRVPVLCRLGADFLGLGTELVPPPILVEITIGRPFLTWHAGRPYAS
jgi:hypothetical protein